MNAVLNIEQARFAEKELPELWHKR